MGLIRSAAIFVSASGAIISFQEEWEIFAGQTWEEMREEGWLQAFHEEDRPLVQQGLSEAAKGGTVSLQARIQRRGKTEAFLFSEVQIRRVPEGRGLASCDGLLVTLFDLGRMRELEAELVCSQQRAEAMLSQAILGICQVNPKGAFLVANQRFCEIVGRSLEDLLGRGLGEIMHPDDRLRWEMLLSVAFNDQKGFEVQNRYLRPKGEVVWTRNYVSVVTDPKRESQFGFLMVQDITSQRAAEGQRINLMLRERAAREEAERANRAKDEFLAMLSHELRTPLTPVLLAASVYEGDHALPPAVREEFGAIRRNIELEARLIDDLLDLTCITHGKMRLECERVDLHLLIRQTLDFIKPSLQGVEILFDFQATDFYLDGDGVRLRQVIWNLLKNAIKFTPPGGTVYVATQNHPPDRIVLKVKDTGVGIHPDLLEKVFDPFEQGKWDNRRGGLGLGLTITKAIVNLHGGEISVESEGMGQGATFTVSLKIVPGETKDLEAAGGKKPSSLKEGLTVLLVEDHLPTLEILMKLLKRRGYRVWGVPTLKEGLELAEREKLDLLISDLGLPDGTGLELMKLLRERSSIPGIALTGFGTAEDVLRVQEAGFARHLVKPIHFEELCQAILEVLPSSPS